MTNLETLNKPELSPEKKIINESTKQELNSLKKNILPKKVMNPHIRTVTPEELKKREEMRRFISKFKTTNNKQLDDLLKSKKSQNERKVKNPTRNRKVEQDSKNQVNKQIPKWLKDELQKFNK